jgi:HSP20 family molecular chaperone IbpA|tara:strand:- start:357 stop:683 length:327 start_codon:yes stop_codon:yes gene_type:complete
MNSLINTLFNDLTSQTFTKPITSHISDTGDVYSAEVELPGFAKKDISIYVVDNTLCVTAKNKERSEKFKLHLWDLVSEDHISAELKYGLLNITLPKRTVSDGREIPIK